MRYFRQLKLLAPVCIAALVGGCFWQSPPPPMEETPPPSPVIQFMIESTPGNTSVLDDPVFGPEVRITLETAFLSASGEDCRRATVLSLQQEAEIVVICRNPEGQWTLAPRIWGRGLSQ